jgi:aquaporin rerated protein, invertebrate
MAETEKGTFDVEVDKSEDTYNNLIKEEYTGVWAWRKLFMEAVATFIFSYGAMSAKSDLLFMTAFWFAVLISGEFSGCHVNMTVTWTLVFRPIESFPALAALAYTGVQFLGALLGGLLFCFQNDVQKQSSPSFFELTGPQMFRFFISELFGTFCLIFGVLIQSGSHHSFVSNRVLGAMAVTVGIMAGRNVSTYSGSFMNTTIGLSYHISYALYAADWNKLTFIPVYILGPFAGGFLALAVYVISYLPLIEKVRRATLPMVMKH